MQQPICRPLLRRPPVSRCLDGNLIGPKCWCALLCSLAFLQLTGETAASETTGTVSGTIRYTADPGRPWRFQRYYVKQDSGALSEAVVALDGSSLKGWPAAPGPAESKMDQLNYQFIPETLAIRTGDSVRFSNSDSTTHNVKSDSPIATFNVNMEAGGDFTHRFRRAGGLRRPVRIGCIYHGGMRAWIYVFDHPFFHVTRPDGSFRFENVPAGKYTVQLLHPAGDLQWKKTIHIDPDRETKLVVELSADNQIRR